MAIAMCKYCSPEIGLIGNDHDGVKRLLLSCIVMGMVLCRKSGSYDKCSSSLLQAFFVGRLAAYGPIFLIGIS